MDTDLSERACLPSRTGRTAWILIGLLWIVAVLNYVDRQVVFSVFPLLRSELGLTDVQLGLLSTAFLWVYGFLSPVGGFLADRFGRRKLILVSLAVWSAVTWATSLARNFGELFAARALMGISEACYLPAALALIADHHGSRTRSLATGIHQSGLYVGIVLGGAGGGWLAQHYGWRFAFGLLGLAGIAYAGVLIYGLPRAPQTEATALQQKRLRMSKSVFVLVSVPGFASMWVVNSLAAIAYWMVYTWLPLHLYERFGMGLAKAGYSATIYIQLASVAGILIAGWLADRWSRRTGRARLYTQIIGFTVAAPFLFIVGRTGSAILLIISLIAFGLGKGFYDCNVMPVLCQIIDPSLRATAYGLFNFASCLMGGLMAAAAGALKDTVGLGAALQFSAVLLFFSGLLLLRVPLTAALTDDAAASERAAAATT